MSLPPGFLDELRTRLTLSQVVGRKVIWDQRKSNQARGDFWAPCPFHHEKTASFHVDDAKGFYYCFGCHAKGDAISFLRETENLSFIEAVELLAREAGVTMPERDPQAAERADRRNELTEIVEMAVQFYRLQLGTTAGARARDYLAGRRLDAGAQDRFGIGFAPEGRQALWSHLRGKGVDADRIVAAGLAIRPEDGGQPYDRFRGRIIFPIRDGRGHAISLGGRALDPAARAKYLNGPETAIFDKGRSLFNLAPARAAAGRGEPLIVAEGYMDVIALSEAGFAAAVAPLGTAITEEQLRLLWRVAPEPVIALDGDKAGLRAAMRLIDLALPMLEAGRSLRFCVLPAGQDPDDLIRGAGPQAMAQQIEAARPMVELLWQRETEGRDFDSPERRAALDKRLRALLRTIADPGLRHHYGTALAERRAALFGPARIAAPGSGGEWRGDRAERAGTYSSGTAGRGKWQGRTSAAAPRPSTRASALAAAPETAAGGEYLHEAVILATLVVHPGLIARFEPELVRLDLGSPGHERLRAAILTHADAPDLREKIAAEAGDALEKLFSLAHVQIAPPVRKTDDEAFAALCLAEELAKLEAQRAVDRETADAMADLDGLADEGLTWRLSQATAARHRAARAGQTDGQDLGEDRNALSRHLQELIDAQIWVKNKG